MKKIILSALVLISAISCVSVPQTDSKENQAPPPVVTTKTATNVSYLREAERGTIIVPGIFFDRAKYNLSGDYKRSLDILKQVMDGDTNIKIIIEGHTSTEGKAYPYNYELSKKRADAVYNYIIKNTKLPKDRFTLKYYGEAIPEHPAPKLFLNRRVQFVIIKNKEDLEKYNLYTKNVDIKKEH